jgi:hypothetical protein
MLEDINVVSLNGFPLFRPQGMMREGSLDVDDNVFKDIQALRSL